MFKIFILLLMINVKKVIGWLFNLNIYFFSIYYKKILKISKSSNLRWPGVEPESAAWKATMLTVTPPSLFLLISSMINLSLEI